MIYSSADILSALGDDAIIRQECRLSIVDGKPGLGIDEYIYIYIDRYPTVEDFQATWKIWVINAGSDLQDLVLNAMAAILPGFEFKGDHYTTTDFANEKTVVRSQADIELEATRREREELKKSFSGLSEGLEARLRTVRDGRDGIDGKDGLDGRDGKDGRDGVDGRDGRDLAATEVNLEDLRNVEQNIAKKDGQVLTWKDGVWQNLFIPQVVSSVSGKGATLASGYYTNQPLTWNGTSWAPGGEIQLDTSNLTDPAEGGLTWEQDEHTAVLGVNGIHAHLGHDSFLWVRNNTASPIARGEAVMFVGTLGNSGRLLVAPMVADGTYPGYVFLGIAAEEILPGVDGNVYTQGKVKGVDTSGYAEGAILWCDPLIPGRLTETQPAAPALKLPVAAVISSQNNGILMVRAKAGERLEDLHDVNAVGQADGDVLTWSAANGRWEPVARPASLIGRGTWRYGLATSGAPATSEILINNSNPALATEVYLSRYSSENKDVYSLLTALVKAGTLFYLQNGAADNYYLYNVTSDAVQVGGTHVTVFVSIRDTGPAANFQNNNVIGVSSYSTPGTGSGSIPEAPQDGNYYVRQNAGWVLLTDALTALNVTWS